ncbi:MAG: GNAT family N-acetyltransferase [Candidatus Vogelbacteria bacterium]|nr:GNAT family N-acetyltransferase [Candidatus Vogelbacteria bacterium]
MAEIDEQISSTEIKLAEPADLAGISELVSRAYQTPNKPGGFCNLANDSEGKLTQEIAGGAKIFVIKKDGVIVGTNRYHVLDGVCHLNRLAVAPEFRRQGIGRKLIERTLGEAKKEGATLAKLECLEEKGLVPYYESFGFKITGQEPHHKHTLVMMEKNLN